MIINSIIKTISLILQNKSFITSDTQVFDKKTFAVIKAMFTGELPKNYELTSEEINLINSVLTQSYVLSKQSPTHLKSNFEIAMNSIKLSSESANYINWSNLTTEEIAKLIPILIKSNYCLSKNSPDLLRENIDLALSSIKKNKHHLKYVSNTLKYHPDIFKYLLLNNYNYTESEIINQPISSFKEFEVTERAFKKLNLSNELVNSIIPRFNKLYNDIINQKVKIADFEPFLNSQAEEAWKSYRKKNYGLYDNIFGKICGELRNSDNFEVALNRMFFLGKMHERLDEKYFDLYYAMQEYFNIYHSNTPNKLSRLTPPANKISSLSAIYISRSKEKFFDEEITSLKKVLFKYFTLKLDHPYVYKRLVLATKKEKFKELYKKDALKEISDQYSQSDISEFIHQIINTYRHEIPIHLLNRLLNDFIIYNQSDIRYIIYPPCYYQYYQRYQKALKLINRLNAGYISYHDKEVFNYQDLISYDESTKKYIYIGRNFTENEEASFSEYKHYEQIFKKIKQQIMAKVKTLDYSFDIDKNLLNNLAHLLPFTDEYFEFNSDYAREKTPLKNLINPFYEDDALPKFNFTTINNDEVYNHVSKFLINNNIIWYLMILKNEEISDLSVIDYANLIEVVNNMPKVISLAKQFNIDLNNLSNLLTISKISNSIDEATIAILGTDIITKLYEHLDYTSSDVKIIIKMAKELVCQMAKRETSTVPYINGEYLNYHYTLYDSQDISVLTSGIDTEACFRIDGNDNDFFHYCVLDKNGIIIKITDQFGNFIARASGFRHGNCVFFNQLRTIYDRGGVGYNHRNCNGETLEIIATFKKACQDIVRTSQNNTQEASKIDFVFINKCYCLEDYEEIVSEEITDEIGLDPMDNISPDWLDFVNNTKNLDEVHRTNAFTTDYGLYPLVCMASIKSTDDIDIDDIIRKDVKAVYHRPRQQIIVTSDITEPIIKKINQITAINCHHQKTKFNLVDIPSNSLVVLGDNWYLIYNSKKILSSCVLTCDPKANIEYETTIKILKNNPQTIISNLKEEPSSLATVLNNRIIKIRKKLPYQDKSS